MVKVVNKGYTLSVTSWENDGDNYKTESKTFDTKEEAIKVVKMCKELFRTYYDFEGGIGNTCGNDEIDKANVTILRYMEKHPDFFENQSEMSRDNLIYKVMGLNHDLMGVSEYYYSRAYESAVLTYSPDDIFLEEIKF